jgi:hypothetical protein
VLAGAVLAGAVLALIRPLRLFQNMPHVAVATRTATQTIAPAIMYKHSASEPRDIPSGSTDLQVALTFRQH